MTTLLSVIVPAYNCARYISAALSSARAQLDDDSDVWVIDDGSTDSTLALARGFASDDPRFHILTQPNSGGPAMPRNRGLALSQGTFIAFLDPDDYFLPGKIAEQLAVLRAHSDIAMVFSDNVLVDEAGTPTGERYLQRANFLERALPHLYELGDSAYSTHPSFYAFASSEVAGPTTSGVMLRRSALTGLTEWFAEDLGVGEDLDLWFRIMATSRVAFIDRPLNAYRQHPKSLMQSGERSLEGSTRAHVRNYERARLRLSREQRRRYRARIAALLFHLGYYRAIQGDTTSARASYCQSMRWRPQGQTLLAYIKALVVKRAPSSSRE